jgi:hypothetical protein
MDPESGVHFQVRGPSIVPKSGYRFSARTMLKIKEGIGWIPMARDPANA